MSADDALRIRSVQLCNFRSYTGLRLNFCGKPVALSGPNGAGKTNLLEALSMLAPGRGMRRARLVDLARQAGKGDWAATITMSAGQMTDAPSVRLGVGCAAPSVKKNCRIDAEPVAGPGIFAKYCRFLWLSPAQDRLFMEGAAERRRFLDRMTLAHDPAHGQIALAYEKSMRERQVILEAFQPDVTLLDILEQRMATQGVAIATARREMVRRLSTGVELVGDTSFPVADIRLDGYLEAALLDEVPAVQLVDIFASRLAQRRRADKAAGRATEGPHRSDLVVCHKEKAQAARFCSTGEQKALLIGLVLANACALVATPATDTPSLILLLDEVAAHLDENRRMALFDILERTQLQAFATGTDAALFESWGERAEHFDIRDGHVSRL